MDQTNPTPPGPPPPPPAAAAPHPPSGGASNNTLMLVLSYLWFLALVPFLVEKNDPEVQWHAKHGLVLLVAEIILWIALNAVQWVLGAIIGPLACFGCIGFAIVGVGEIVVHIIAISKALNGQRLIIPGLSHYADQF